MLWLTRTKLFDKLQGTRFARCCVSISINEHQITPRLLRLSAGALMWLGFDGIVLTAAVCTCTIVLQTDTSSNIRRKMPYAAAPSLEQSAAHKACCLVNETIHAADGYNRTWPSKKSNADTRRSTCRMHHHARQHLVELAAHST